MTCYFCSQVTASGVRYSLVAGFNPNTNARARYAMVHELPGEVEDHSLAALIEQARLKGATS